MRLRINAVASGVLVTDAWVEAMSAITATGTACGCKQKKAQNECANGAAAKNSGKMLPPKNLPEQAIAMATNFATPI